MAKKIRLDFSKVEERSGWNTRHIPDGLHEFKIESVQETEASDGTDMLVYALRPTASKYKTRLFPFYCKLQPNQLWKLRDLFVAAGIDVPKKAQNIDPNKPVGKVVAGEVEEETGQYAGRSSVQGIYDASIIDGEDEPAEDQDDEDEVEDEEYDDEADEDDEDDDAEEGDEDDELREELEGLTLPALRKRAKGLGIDTAGVKQADLIELVLEEELGEADEDEEDDDEDLGDEELEDEDFDDDEDEEEEEPAPARRRPAAKKAPAKAPAKAAPAKRTVKRR